MEELISHFKLYSEGFSLDSEECTVQQKRQKENLEFLWKQMVQINLIDVK